MFSVINNKGENHDGNVFHQAMSDVVAVLWLTGMQLTLAEIWFWLRRVRAVYVILTWTDLTHRNNCFRHAAASKKQGTQYH